MNLFDSIRFDYLFGASVALGEADFDFGVQIGAFVLGKLEDGGGEGGEGACSVGEELDV